nr:right-handed parallel beta-helix repeat-containing protein [bacterium]
MKRTHLSKCIVSFAAALMVMLGVLWTAAPPTAATAMGTNAFQVLSKPSYISVAEYPSAASTIQSWLNNPTAGEFNAWGDATLGGRMGGVNGTGPLTLDGDTWTDFIPLSFTLTEQQASGNTFSVSFAVDGWDMTKAALIWLDYPSFDVVDAMITSATSSAYQALLSQPRPSRATDLNANKIYALVYFGGTATAPILSFNGATVGGSAVGYTTFAPSNTLMAGIQSDSSLPTDYLQKIINGNYTAWGITTQNAKPSSGVSYVFSYTLVNLSPDDLYLVWFDSDGDGYVQSWDLVFGQSSVSFTCNQTGNFVIVSFSSGSGGGTEPTPTPTVVPSGTVGIEHDWEVSPVFDASKDLYVATTGTDAAGYGTQSSPYRTIQYAVDRLQAGGTVWVAPGTYTSGFNTTAAGSPTAWRRVAAQDPDNRPIITNGSISTSSAQASSICSFYINSAYWVLDGMDIRGGNYGGQMTKAQVAAAVGNGSNGYDTTAFRAMGRYGIYMNHASFIVVRNNSVDGVLVTGIFAAQSPNIVYEYNYSANNGEHGYYYNNSANNFRYTANVSRHNNGCGFHLNGDIDTLPLESFQQRSDILPLGICMNGIYEYNATINNGTGWYTGSGGGAGYNFSSLQNGIVRGNYSYNDYAGGMTFYCGDSADTSRNVEIYNNTILLGGSTSRYVVNFDGQGVQHSCSDHGAYPNPNLNAPLNLRFYNNIFGKLNGSVNNMVTLGEGSLASGHGVEFKNNLFLTSASSAVFPSAIAADARADNLFVANANMSTVFADAGTGDLSLASGTGNPAAGAGLQLPTGFLVKDSIYSAVNLSAGRVPANGSDQGVRTDCGINIGCFKN